MNRYRIGHPAYKHENRMAYVSGKAAAIRELRGRGCKRDDARDAVKRADQGSHTGCWGGRSGFNPVEIIRIEE
jgi:hypothetical protein